MKWTKRETQNHGFVCCKIMFAVLEVEEAMAAVGLPWEVASGPVRLYVNYEIWSLVMN